MNKMKSIIIISASIAIFMAPSLSIAAGNLFIVGLDETSSYDLRESVMNELEKFIFSGLQPGDALIGRRITDQSYRDMPDNLLLPSPLNLPLIDSLVNQGNNQAVRQYQKSMKRDKLLRLQAIKHLRGLNKINPPKTDIYGFLAVCSDYFQHFTDIQHKVILIASDMKDNCQRQADIDLAGARILIIGFERDADPAKNKKLQESWVKKLESLNAGQVIFVPAMIDFMSLIKSSEKT